MSNTTTATPNRNINQIMKDGDVGPLVSKNKNALIAIMVALLVAVIGFGLYSTMADKSKTASNSKIYAFESTSLKDWNEKSEPKVLVEGIKNLHKEVGNYSGLIPVVLKASDALIEHNHLNEALEVLTTGQKASKNDYANYFILNRLAVVYEDLGNDKMAIETLEKMNNQSVKIFEGKNYLDLGRLYLKSGNKEKAKTSFNFVVEKAKDEAEFVKIAKLYLSKL
ncbi:MAG: tetratricopeptide repeat protein [Bacteriovorax sp.]|jgi:predicted negative regulator of RcsB-dependent stress response